MSEEIFDDFRNLSEIFPNRIKHCTGDAGFDIPTTLAPPGYCIRGGRRKYCHPPQCVHRQSQFVRWSFKRNGKFGPWFNQFVRNTCMCHAASNVLHFVCLLPTFTLEPTMSLVLRRLYCRYWSRSPACMYCLVQNLENIMLRRWATTTWNYSHPIVIVPSPYMHCEPTLYSQTIPCISCISQPS